MITSRYNDEVFSEGIIVATKMWMIRGDGGKLYDDFRDKQVVAIGWSQLAPYVKPGCSREQLFTRYLSHRLSLAQFVLVLLRSGAL